MPNIFVTNSLFFGRLGSLSGIITALPELNESRVGFDVIADSGNTGIVYIGDNTVSTNTGWPLRPSEKLRINMDKPSNVYVVTNQVSSVSGVPIITNAVRWIGQ